MNSENLSQDQTDEIPEDATVIRQIQYAWLWSSMPWLIILGVIYYTEFLIEPLPVVGAVITVIILVPRYLAWRRSAYILTNDALILQRGGITRTKRYTLPISKLSDVRARYGFFGKSLGYQTVDIMVDNGAVVRLTYVPIQEDVVGVLKELIAQLGPAPDEAQNGDGPREERPSSGPDVPPPDTPSTE